MLKNALMKSQVQVFEGPGVSETGGESSSHFSNKGRGEWIGTVGKEGLSGFSKADPAENRPVFLGLKVVCLNCKGHVYASS